MTTAIEAGKAYVSLGVKSTLDKDLRKSKATLKKFAKMSAKLFAGVAAASFGVAAASLAKLVEKSNELGRLAGEIGITTQELQKLEYVGANVGLSLEDMVGGIEEMQVRLAEASAYGTGPAVEMLDKLGISLKDLEGLSAEDKIGVIADELMKLDAVSRQFAADELFGGDGRRMMNMFALGSEGIKQMAAEAVNLGLVLSDDTKTGLKVISNAWLDLESAFQGAIGNMASDYSDEMQMIVAATRVAISDIGKAWDTFVAQGTSWSASMWQSGLRAIGLEGTFVDEVLTNMQEDAEAKAREMGEATAREFNKGQERAQRREEQAKAKLENDKREKARAAAEKAQKGTTVHDGSLDNLNALNNTFSAMIPDGAAPTPGSVTSALSSTGSFVGGAGVGQGTSQVVQVGEKQLNEQKKTNEKLDEMKRMADMNNGGGTMFSGGI